MSFLPQSLGPLVPLSLLLLIGCAAKPPGGTLTLERPNGQLLTQTFTNAYITQSQVGEIDILLVDNAEPKPATFKKNRPLQPTALSPLHEVMHIHLYWKPLAGIRKNP